jgi:hypothetical protein
MTTRPAPGTASGGDQERAQITDEQVIRWAAEAAGAGPAAAGTMRAVHRHFDLAKLVLTRRCPDGSGHLLESVELLGVQSGHSGTLTGVVLTVDLPPGRGTPQAGTVRLCTREFDLEELVDPDRQYATAEDLYTDLLTGALSCARDEIGKHRRALRYDQLTEALALARAAMDGDSGDAWHDALHGLAELVAAAEDLLAIPHRDDLTAAPSLPAAGGEMDATVCPTWGTVDRDRYDNDRARCTSGHERDQPAGDGLNAVDDEDCCSVHGGGILLGRGRLREWAGLGRYLTDGELGRLADCIGGSSIPDALGTVVSDALQLGDAGQEDEAGTGTKSSG